MTKMNNKFRSTEAGQGPNDAGKGITSSASKVSSRQLWIMRLMAATLVPLFFLGLLEVSLRLAGYGYSTDFFVPSEINGEDFLIPNRKFTHQFFPPALARAPLPMRIAAQKPEGTYRIFLFGESAAYGDPDPSFGMGRFLEALLETRYPETDFEVVCVAITAINSHVILPIARDCAKRDGDMWVIYMGNNEMVGPFGAGTVFGEKAPGLTFVRTSLLLKSTRIGQLIADMIASARGGTGEPDAWGGIEMFSQNQLRHDDPARLKAYENFRGNLESILKEGEKAGVPVVLSTVGSNLRDCSPFSSLHRVGLGQDDLDFWDELFQKGIELEEAGSFQSALDQYLQAAAIDKEFAELQFRIGKCYLEVDEEGLAGEAFRLARDFDTLAVRADTKINQIILDVINEYEGDSFLGVDAEMGLTHQEPDGIPGKELFYEHVHFTLEGNYRIARIIADKLCENVPVWIRQNPVVVSSEEEYVKCVQQLAITLWDQKRVWDVALGRISVEPFTSQSSHLSNAQYCKDRMSEVDSRTTPSSPARDRQLYVNALRKNPDDTLIRWNYAQFFEMIGSLPEAIVQGKELCDRLPHAPWPHYFVGSVLAREGRLVEAVDYLQAALAIEAHSQHAQNELDKIRASYPHLVGEN
jgi:tetratricopeptide (TPR) repeat protein